VVDFKRTRFISFGEVFLHVGVPVLVSIGLLVLVFSVESELAAKVLGVAGCVAALVWGGFTFLKKLRATPAFETDLGSLVWVEGVETTKVEIDRAQLHFIKHVVRSGRAGNEAIKKIFKGMRITLVPKTFIFDGKKYNGLAWSDQGVIRVAWLSGIQENALFHEMMHVTQLQVFGYGDAAHEKTKDWDLVREMKRTFNA